ncbi:hypothetical protein IWQ61_002473 [Dispira simplex]|nr:hypothetical protein IWQ61_002473 [Dispira simplex]
MRNKILMLSPLDVNAHALVHTIIHPNRSSPSLPDDEACVVPWRIDTKYYTANVEFWIDKIPLPEQGTANSKSPTPSATDIVDEFGQVADVIDALVYVFDITRPDTFAGIHTWATFVKSHDIAIALCVGCVGSLKEDKGLMLNGIITDGTNQNTDAVTEHEEDYGTFASHHAFAEESEVRPAISPSNNGGDDAEFEDWCLDHGFEYIRVEPHGHTSASSSPGDGTMGIARVVEALQSHMWQGMIPKSRSADGPVPVRSDPLTQCEVSMSLSGEHRKNELFRTNGKAKLNGVLRGTNRPELTDVDAAFRAFANDQDGLDELITQIRYWREFGQGMTDDERHNLAADISQSFVDHCKHDDGA